MPRLRANLDKPGTAIDWKEVQAPTPAQLRALAPRRKSKAVWHEIPTAPDIPKRARPRMYRDRVTIIAALDPDADDLLRMIQAHLKKEHLLIRTERATEGDDPHLGVILGEALRFWWKHAKKEATEK